MEVMQEEILNIDYHIKILVMKALTRYPNHGDAAAALGISVRTLHRYKVQFKIQLIGKQYQIIDKNNNNGKNEFTRTGHKGGHGIHGGT